MFQNQTEELAEMSGFVSDDFPVNFAEDMESLIRDINMESSPEPEFQIIESDLINELTDECLLRIFLYLNKIELCHCGLVCKRWYIVMTDKSLWRIVDLAPVTFNIEDKFFDLFASTRLVATQKLYLGGLRISFNMLKSITQYCKSLKALMFGRSSSIEEHPVNAVQNQKVAFPKTIKTFDVRLTSGCFEFLNETGHNYRNITNLGIGAHSFNTVALNIFFTKVPNLQVVDFTNCLQIDDIAIEILANNCPHIKSLCLIGCRMVYGTTFNILIDKCHGLRTLLLRYLKIDDDILMQNSWKKSNIEELDISACPRVTWHGLYNFLVQLKHLVYLNMSYCGEGNAVNDGVLRGVAEAGFIGNLRMLDIRWSFYVTPQALEALLKKTKDLEYLGIYQSFHIFSQHLTELVRYVPRLKILEFGSSYPEELSFSNIIPQLTLMTKRLEVLSLINFTATQTKLAYKYLKVFLKRLENLKRINFCDCSHDLVKVGKQAAKKCNQDNVYVTVKWECALPPPINTLDDVIAIKE